MVGNPKLAEMGFGEEAQGHNAIASGFQGQRQWTDTYPNGDFLETMLEWMPTAVVPGTEAFTNKRIGWRRGEPIIPRKLEAGVEAEQFRSYTPQVYRALAAKLGGSPMKWQHFIEGHFSGMAKMGSNLLDVIAGREETGRKATAPDYPLIRGFVSREPVGDNSDSVKRFYDLASQYEKQWSSALRRYGGSKRARRHMREAIERYPMLEDRRTYKAGLKKMSELRQQRAKAQLEGNEEREKRINREMTNAARLYLAQLGQIRPGTGG